METNLLHTFYGNRNHLGIRLWRVKANEFDAGLARRVRERSLHWFGADRDCQAWEPGGDQ